MPAASSERVDNQILSLDLVREMGTLRKQRLKAREKLGNRIRPSHSRNEK